MKRHLTILIGLLLAVAGLQAQEVLTVSGTVTDRQTHERLAHVSVSAGQVATVTNEHGDFTLKLPTKPEAIVCSHVGYKTSRTRLSDGVNRLRIELQPDVLALSEVVVSGGDAEELVRQMLKRAPDNYGRTPVRYRGFCRETVQRRQHLASVAEAVVDMYKTGYQHGTGRDGVAIGKGRRLLSIRAADTLGVKVMGGPVMPVVLDVVKNPDFLLSEEELANYRFSFDIAEKTGGRLQYVVRMAPRYYQPYAQFSGRLFIDQQSLALTRAELSMDMSDRELATQAILIRRPAGLRFRPRELSLVLDYRTEQGVTRLSYLRSVIRFSCDWRRRLFSSTFTATNEMVVTDVLATGDEARPVRGEATFSRRDKLYDKVELFSDPGFWGTDNIIEPTESLEHAIERLRKRISK